MFARSNLSRTVSRRQCLQLSALGFGHLAFQSLLADQLDGQTAWPARARSSSPSPSSSPFAMAPGSTHFEPRARRVIFLFMKGGPSHLDTFDYKPRLQKDDGKELPFAKPRVQFAPTGKLLRSPWKFRPYGESGMLVSELFPHVAKHVDQLCFLHSVHGTNPAHGGACLKLHTGSDTFVRPSMGSWVFYGLGTENQNLPGFITICPTLAHGGVKNWGSAFLPANFQGTPLGVASQPATQAKLKFTQNPEVPESVQQMQLQLLDQLDRPAAHRSGASQELDARLQSFELAFRMQAEVPQIQDLSGESKSTRQLYGLDRKETEDFGRQCLLARRFVERGVRFVQVTHSNTDVQWDQHSNLKKGHEQNAREVDYPIAGLLTDLKQRGLLEDTLVMWSGEFGRTPTVQGRDGRDHNPEGFTVWLAGGGVRPGFRYGSTDEYGYYATDKKMHVHDLHATLLHLLGLDHQRLTYPYAGRDFRLTDVAGNVAHEIMV